MKSMRFLHLLVLIFPVIRSWPDRNDAADLTHEGEKWNISSVHYTLIYQTASGQVYKTGTTRNAMAFYFVRSENRGSIELEIEGYTKEDLFSCSMDAMATCQFCTSNKNWAKRRTRKCFSNGVATEMNLHGSI